MSTGLRNVADRAKREPAARFHSLAHLIDEGLLAGAFARLRSNAAVGVDGITKERARLDWGRFHDFLEGMPLPKARIVVSIWR